MSDIVFEIAMDFAERGVAIRIREMYELLLRQGMNTSEAKFAVMEKVRFFLNNAQSEIGTVKRTGYLTIDDIICGNE